MREENGEGRCALAGSDISEALVESLELRVAELSRTVESLRAGEERYKHLVERMSQELAKTQSYLDIAGVVLVVVGTDHRVKMINRKGSAILGRAEPDIVGKDWFECFVPERMRALVRRVFDKLMAGEIAPVGYFENPLLTSRGEERLLAWHNTLLVDKYGVPVGTLSSGEDITDRRLAEKKLLRLERMRAMSDMTARISHNLNNILVGVTAHCQFLEKASDDPTVLAEAVAIMKSAKRAENLGWHHPGRERPRIRNNRDTVFQDMERSRRKDHSLSRRPAPFGGGALLDPRAASPGARKAGVPGLRPHNRRRPRASPRDIDA